MIKAISNQLLIKFEQNFDYESRDAMLNPKIFTYQEKIEEETESDKHTSEEQKKEITDFVGIVSRSQSLASVSEASQNDRKQPKMTLVNQIENFRDSLIPH